LLHLKKIEKGVLVKSKCKDWKVSA
jgi:hypothetical protein